MTPSDRASDRARRDFDRLARSEIRDLVADLPTVLGRTKTDAERADWFSQRAIDLDWLAAASEDTDLAADARHLAQQARVLADTYRRQVRSDTTGTTTDSPNPGGPR